MSGSDWNNLGKDVKNIVQHAIDTGDFKALNKDLGATLENALGNVADSVKNAGKAGAENLRGTAGRFSYDQKEAQKGESEPYRQGENPKPYGPGNGYSKSYSYKPFGNYRSNSKNSVSAERVKKAKEEFALFVNTGGARALGILCTTLGIALTLMFGITAGAFGIASLFTDVVADKIGRIMLVFLPATGLSAVLGIWGNALRKKIGRFRSYVKTLNGKPYGSIRDLAKSVRKSERFVRRDLKKMIHKRMFLEGHLDAKGTCLIASDEAYEQYMQTEKNQKALKEREAKEPKKQLSQEVQEIMEEGNKYIEEIRRSNDAIPGIEVSNKLYHLENVILRIFQRVEKHPELIDDLHKFMDYYLPTTVKLLNAYEELDKQDLEGENIKSAKQEIENTLDTINTAFENLLDSFYKETAWDVSSDISVLKTMLAQEGLTGKDEFQGKEK